MERHRSESSMGLLNGPQPSNYDSVPNVEINNGTENEDSRYTELLRGSVPCPSCRGLGHIPKEQEGQLVALIPMKDKRLRPRRTYLWVGLAVILCVTVAGLVIFFLFPRSVDLTSKKPYLNPVGPVTINVTERYVNFIVMNSFNISNHNYVPIKVTGVSMNVMYDIQLISESSNNTIKEVGIRSSAEYHVSANITFNNYNNMGYMAPSCQMPVRWEHELVMMFQFTCNYEMLGHSEQVTLQTYQFVSCYSDIKPSTIGPASTTKPTTTTTTTTTTPKPQ